MNFADVDVNSEVASSDMTNMLLNIKEEPLTMADELFTMIEANENSVPMMAIKEELSEIACSSNEPTLMDNFAGTAGQDNGLDGPFCFETDHVALKNNKDYQHLLRTIVLLESQRVTAIRDLDTLLMLQKSAVADPIKYVEKLQSGADMGVPRRQKVASLPSISWDRYTADVDAAMSVAAIGRSGSVPLTRNKIKTLLSNSMKEEPELASEEISKLTKNSQNLEDMEDGSESLIKNRSSTFGQRWTAEEHKRFEQLLKKYPEERNQTKRHEKIARALGNRTTVQVASHIQKYFKKLAEWKLPVPGPAPHPAVRRRMTGSRGRYRKRNCELYAASSAFLTSYELPAYMSENESEDETYPGVSFLGRGENAYTTSEAPNYSSEDEKSDDDFDDELIPQHLKNSAEFVELKMLKNVKREYEDVKLTAVILKCVVCKEKLIGVSWRCFDCLPGQVIQFCSACSKTEFQMGSHVSGHLLEKVDVSLVGPAAIDQDYSNSTAETYNYLDPNYRAKKDD